MIPFPNRLTTGLAALAACIALNSCKSTNSGTSPDGLVDYTSHGSAGRPSKLPKEEYPFDEAGNYREDWAAKGAGVSGVKDRPTDTALYTQPSDGGSRGPINSAAYTPDEETPMHSTPSTGSHSTASTNKKPATMSSHSSGGGGPTTASHTTSGKPKPGAKSTTTKATAKNGSKPTSNKTTAKTTSKPASKPAAKSTTVTVKSGDTLYSLSKKYGVSVASIKSANGMKSDTLVDGRSVKIPKKN